MGSKNGVKKGDILSIYMPDGAVSGNAEVWDVFPRHSVAIAPGWQKIKPGFEIRLLSRE